jgi:hypothetical protein
VNKEKIYDERISPLMAQILTICKENGIAMVAQFAIPNPDDPDLVCTSCLTDESSKLSQDMEAARQILTKGFIAFTQRVRT